MKKTILLTSVLLSTCVHASGLWQIEIFNDGLIGEKKTVISEGEFKIPLSGKKWACKLEGIQKNEGIEARNIVCQKGKDSLFTTVVCLPGSIEGKGNLKVSEKDSFYGASLSCK